MVLITPPFVLCAGGCGANDVPAAPAAVLRPTHPGNRIVQPAFDDDIDDDFDGLDDAIRAAEDQALATIAQREVPAGKRPCV